MTHTSSRALSASLVVLAVAASYAPDAAALNTFLTTVPNTSVAGCQTCHIGKFGGKNWNDFGLDVKANLSGGAPDWGAVCDLDSDGDGASNGQELQDAACEWLVGAAQPGDLSLVTAPGDPTSSPEPEDPIVVEEPAGEDAGPVPPADEAAAADDAPVVVEEMDAPDAASGDDDTVAEDAGPVNDALPSDETADETADEFSGDSTGSGGGDGCGAARRGASPPLPWLLVLAAIARVTAGRRLRGGADVPA